MMGAPRCPLCCEHAVPLDKPCPWCDDILDGVGGDCILGDDEPMLLGVCPHGVGEPPS